MFIFTLLSIVHSKPSLILKCPEEGGSRIFLWRCALTRKGVTDCWRKQILKANTKQKLHLRWRGCTLPASSLILLDSPLLSILIKEKVTPKNVYFLSTLIKPCTKFSHLTKFQPLKCRFSLWNLSPNIEQCSAARPRFLDVIPDGFRQAF